MFGVPLKNLMLFAGVFAAATLAMFGLLFWLATQFGLDAGNSAASIPPFAAACIFGGYNYATKSDWNWTREDRRNLAIAYAAVSYVIGLIFSFAYLALDPSAFAILRTFWGVFAIVLGGLFGSLISYALARLLLGQVVRQKREKAQ